MTANKFPLCLGIGEIMKLKCKYCSLVKDFENWKEIQAENNIQCWVTVKGVNHHYNQVVIY